MSEILGLGITHYPPLAGRDDNMSGILRATLQHHVIPPGLRQPIAWPALMQEEWSTDEGTGAAGGHRRALLNGFAKIRGALDEFRPDFVLIWSDDQYENFTEDIVPPFCVLAYDSIQARPWKLRHAGMPGADNVWGEPEDFVYPIRCDREAAKFLVSGLIAEGFDVSYAYQPLHADGVGHAFLNSIAFLDYYRTGFDHRVVCFSVNCYGRKVIAEQGNLARFTEIPPEKLDPPSPSPARCMDLGAATARILKDSPYRVALMASSSWSHAFLHERAWRLYPDVESDRAFYEALRAGNYSRWRNTSLEALEQSGQTEMLNWFCLVGAMDELNRKPGWTDFVESYVFNSNKCFAIFP